MQFAQYLLSDSCCLIQAAATGYIGSDSACHDRRESATSGQYEPLFIPPDHDDLSCVYAW